MTDKDDLDDVTHPQWTEAPHADPAIEEFASGEIRSFHGRVNGWLLAVYAILAVWGHLLPVPVLGWAGARAGAMIAIRLLHALALANLLILIADVLYNILGGLLPLVR
jgi:hypothetical protein